MPMPRPIMMRPEISVLGSANVELDADHTLTLNIDEPGNGPLGWEINWGDGTVTNHAADDSAAIHCYNELGSNDWFDCSRDTRNGSA